jgi:hypothetical protein
MTARDFHLASDPSLPKIATMANGVVLIGGRRGKLQDQGPAAILDCPYCLSRSWHNYFTNRVITTMGGGLWPMIPTGIPRGTEHWLLCSSCHKPWELGLTQYELPPVFAMLNAAKQLAAGELSQDEFDQRQLDLMDDLWAMHGPYTYVPDFRAKEQRKRRKKVGGHEVTRCRSCDQTFGKEPYVPGERVTCSHCGAPARMPTLPASVK